jgi:hypothetical protein
MTTTTNTTAATLANIDYLARAHRASITAYDDATTAAAAAYGCWDGDNLAAACEAAAHRAYLAYAVMNEARAAYDDALARANNQNGN